MTIINTGMFVLHISNMSVNKKVKISCTNQFGILALKK